VNQENNAKRREKRPGKAVCSADTATSRVIIVNPVANDQIFGFRGYVCNKCLTAETHYVAFPNAEGQSRIQRAHFCYPAKVAASSKLADRSGGLRSLHDEILIMQKMDS
jgi:hypothetical protein